MIDLTIGEDYAAYYHPFELNYESAIYNGGTSWTVNGHKIDDKALTKFMKWQINN